jgi:hypothetical protein
MSSLSRSLVPGCCGRRWLLASAPAGADVLAVCGRPGPQLAEAVEKVWGQLPGPRVRIEPETEAVVVGVISVLYGALVALAQTNAKRMIAYTSVNHMGYIVLAVGVAGLVAGDTAEARAVAVTGAVTQMVSHGLITGALFLLAGVLHDRASTYDLGAYGGLAGPAPRFATLFAVGAFASLGLPAFSGFIAEFQVFTGSVAAAPVTAFAVLGILITAGSSCGRSSSSSPAKPAADPSASATCGIRRCGQ